MSFRKEGESAVPWLHFNPLFLSSLFYFLSWKNDRDRREKREEEREWVLKLDTFSCAGSCLLFLSFSSSFHPSRQLSILILFLPFVLILFLPFFILILFLSPPSSFPPPSLQSTVWLTFLPQLKSMFVLSLLFVWVERGRKSEWGREKVRKWERKSEEGEKWMNRNQETIKVILLSLRHFFKLFLIVLLALISASFLSYLILDSRKRKIKSRRVSIHENP